MKLACLNFLSYESTMFGLTFRTAAACMISRELVTTVLVHGRGLSVSFNMHTEAAL